MSFFNTKSVAEGYSKDRPYVHPEIIKKIKLRLNLSEKIKYVLDVGCGAGLSTIALKEIAENIIGVDSSESMIKSAIKDDNIKYFNYPAEYLPFSHKFDLITLAGAINWIDRSKFFLEAKNILNDEGIVVIYDNYILGIMEEDDRFEAWYTNEYLKRYLKPLRDETPITNEEAVKYGFEKIDSENYTNKVKFTLEKFIKYIFTQSNITTVLENQTEDYDHIKEWFASYLAPFFDGHERTLVFGGYIWYLKNVEKA